MQSFGRASMLGTKKQDDELFDRLGSLGAKCHDHNPPAGLIHNTLFAKSAVSPTQTELHLVPPEKHLAARLIQPINRTVNRCFTLLHGNSVFHIIVSNRLQREVLTSKPPKQYARRAPDKRHHLLFSCAHLSNLRAHESNQSSGAS